MAKKQVDDLVEAPAVLESEPVTVEEQPAEALVLVEALMPMWADTDVVLPGTRYHLPQPAAEYLAGMGFVALAVEEAG